MIYAKQYQSDGNELLYKLMKTESKLVRSTLEAAGFHYTEGHDWNMMWINTSSKPYVYEGLNEFQKINHFPNSFEITRKDKLAENIL